MAFTPLFSLCERRALAGNETYVTWSTIEPDKCIAAWLIKTHVNTNAIFAFVPKGAAITGGIPFDAPGSKYVRDHKRSASEVVIAIHRIREPKPLALGRLARKLEIGLWHASFTDKEAPLAEKLMRLSNDRRPPLAVLKEAFKVLADWQP